MNISLRVNFSWFAERTKRIDKTNNMNVRRVNRLQWHDACKFLTQHFAPEKRHDASRWLLSQFEQSRFDPHWLIGVYANHRNLKAAIYLHLDGHGGATTLGYSCIDDKALSQFMPFLFQELKEAGVKAWQTTTRPNNQNAYEPWKKLDFALCQTTEMSVSFVNNTPLETFDSIHLESFQPGRETDFAETLDSTYHDSQDTPELNFVRTPMEAFLSHRNHASNASQLYLIRDKNKQKVGCLFLHGDENNSLKIARNWELTYLGLTPDHRGKGLGRAAAIAALATAHSHGASGMILTIDNRNHIAKNLYESLGFRTCGSYEVYLKTFKG
jgi:RimJ/RimL family protein N-acetyltransferase